MSEAIAVSTDATGSVNLASYTPLSILSVQVDNGSFFSKVMPVQPKEFTRSVQQALNLRLVLIRTPSFPTDDLTDITYGPGLSNWSTFDELIVLKAARMCLIKDQDSLDQGLERQFQETLDAVLNADHVILVYDMPGPFGPTLQEYSFQYFNNTLQLGSKVVF